ALERSRAVDRHIGISERLVASARARYRSGNGRLEDALQAEAEHARVRADQVSFAAAASRALARLDALRGVEPGSSDSSLEALPPLPVPADAGAWRRAAVQDHPRLLEAEARERGFDLSARAARRARWPDLELRGSYGIRGQDRMGMSLDDMISASVGF